MKISIPRLTNPPIFHHKRQNGSQKPFPPRNRIKNHLNPTIIARSSIAVHKSPLLVVQYCSAILLLRSASMLLNPFHPLLRHALSKHEEAHDLGYYFHMHTSSKLLTGKESSMRRNVRAKVRAAWDEALKKNGYDPKTGRFVKHLAKDWDPMTQFRQQDVKGTISLIPTEMCLKAKFVDVVATCEAGLKAVRNCRARNEALEDMMRPSNLWRYYDWRRRLLLKKYTELGFGLSIAGIAAESFQQAVKELRTEEGKKLLGKDGQYLLNFDGADYDISPLKRIHAKEKGFMVTQEAIEEEEVEEEEDLVMLKGQLVDAQQDAQSTKGGLDWGLDDLGSTDQEKMILKHEQTRAEKVPSLKYHNPEPEKDDGF